MSRMIPPQARGCEKNCLFQFSGGSTTCAYYPPIYNKQGVNINPDANITTGKCVCITCNKEWQYKTQFETTEFTEKT